MNGQKRSLFERGVSRFSKGQRRGSEGRSDPEHKGYAGRLGTVEGGKSKRGTHNRKFAQE